MWYQYSNEARKDILMIICRSQKCMIVKTVFFDMSIPTFADVRKKNF